LSTRLLAAAALPLEPAEAELPLFVPVELHAARVVATVMPAHKARMPARIFMSLL
jgi:hypothetical protein